MADNNEQMMAQAQVEMAAQIKVANARGLLAQELGLAVGALRGARDAAELGLDDIKGKLIAAAERAFDRYKTAEEDVAIDLQVLGGGGKS